jgi:hypothetical protein
MNWRRLADVLHIRHAGQLRDERSRTAVQLAELKKQTKQQTVAVRQMSAQSRVGSYRRVRIGR